MHSLTGLVGLLALLLSPHAGAATFNKCIDAQGQVTYSNLPCRNAKEARTLEIDPAPQPDPERMRAVQTDTKPEKPVSSPKEAAPARPDTRSAGRKSASHASAATCDALTDKLGRVVDKIDLAHRKGYTQKQMDTWNQEVLDLERKKQQSGCF